MTALTNEENYDDENESIENSTANEYEQKAYEQKLLFKTALDEYSENLLKTQTNVSIVELIQVYQRFLPRSGGCSLLRRG